MGRDEGTSLCDTVRVVMRLRMNYTDEGWKIIILASSTPQQGGRSWAEGPPPHPAPRAHLDVGGRQDPARQPDGDDLWLGKLRSRAALLLTQRQRLHQPAVLRVQARDASADGLGHVQVHRQPGGAGDATGPGGEGRGGAGFEVSYGPQTCSKQDPQIVGMR